MIKDKHILFLCKDETDKVQYYLIKEMAKENSVGVYYFEPMECTLNKCLYNQNTYYKCSETIKNIKLYDSKQIAEHFKESSNNPQPDIEFLKEIEKNYTVNKPLGLQLLASQQYSACYHNRFFMRMPNRQQMLCLIELNYRKILDIIEDFKPDVILDIDDAGYARTILFECTSSKGIPYITLEHSRVQGFVYPSFTFGLKLDKYVETMYWKLLKQDASMLAKHIEEVAEIRKSNTIMAEKFKGTIHDNFKKPSVMQIMKFICLKIWYFYDMYFINNNYKFYKAADIIFFSPWKQIEFYCQYILKRRILLGKNKYFQEPCADETYVYMPLHLIPESTTSVKAPWFVDELNVISQVSKALPIGWLLYVKEHPAMLGERSLEFYRKVNQFYNVKLVRLDYYSDPKPWIMNAQGVITITGTSAYENALLGKRSLVFSEVPFSIVEGIDIVRSFEQLLELIRNFGECDNIKSCAAYIAVIKKIGKEINLSKMIYEADDCLTNDLETSEEFRESMNSILELYENALTEYEKMQEA